MDEVVYEQLVGVLTSSGMPVDSSAELAFHVALHFPEHGRIILEAPPL